MQAIRQIFWVAEVEFRKFLTIKNLMLMFFAFLFLGENVISKMLEVVAETGIKLNYLEPMNLILSYSFHAMLIPITFIVLLSDFPDKSSSGIFMMARIKRKIWILGQLLYTAMVGVLFLIFMLLGSFIWIGKSGFFSLQWSPYTTQLYLDFPEIYSEKMHLFLETGTVTHGGPVTVIIVGCILMLLYLVTMAQLLCLFKLVKWKRIGLFFDIALTVIGAVAVSYMDKAKWIFPLAHSMFGIHFREFLSQPECKLIYSFLYYGILNLVLILVNMRIAGKCHIGDDCE